MRIYLQGDEMSKSVNKLTALYRKKWLKFTNLDKKEYLSDFDFKKPWWSIFLKRKALLVLILSGRIIASVVITLLPILIGRAIASQKMSSFTLLFFVWVCAEAWRYFTVYNCSKYIASIISGLRYSAYKFFLTVDPIFHAKRSTGELFGKIERCAFAYEELIDSAIYDILPIFVGMITVVISFFMINIYLGLVAFIFLIILCLFNASMVLFNGLAFEKRVIKADDAVKSASMESLLQIQLVRSYFSTNEVNSEIKSKSSFFMSMDGAYFIAFHTAMFFSRFLYALSVCTLGIYILRLINQDYISIITGTTFLVTYVHGTYHIIKIGKRVQKFVRSVTRIKDLFSFIRRFGKQTFPVLKEDPHEAYEVPTIDVISVDAQKIYFSYEQADIFDNHTMKITVPFKQENKLYGIIGPSGVGKTTLISILGGQLRPDKGTVMINEIPIYHVDDSLRRKIIAMQGQTAGSLSGTLKDNVLLGMPKKRSLFKDDYLIDVLQKVGIWDLFKEKEGLLATVGEGGLNLSVGQRQRLNFASLYIRTKYFKPLLIMIDEPTSSLDEVSEQAITDMIEEIAEDALVFVIAHRLNTLDEAVGILDCSLIEKEKDLTFYSRDELLKKSLYYQKLIRGEVTIEE